MRSLAIKFTLVLLLVSLLVVAFIAIIASQVTQREFAFFLDRQDQEEMTGQLAELYEANGGWENINVRQVRIITRKSPGSAPAEFAAIADREGMVVFSNPDHSLGTRVKKSVIDSGLPIEVDGELVGTVLSSTTPRMNILAPAVESFSESINRSLLIASLVAVVVSLLLGIVFSYTLTRQLSELSKATTNISRGKLKQKVEVKSKDEIGQLVTAFNQMSDELERSQDIRRQMTADIAHELRTPLSIILGRAETLAEGMLPPSEEVFHVIYEEAQRVNRLVEDLRTLSLSDAGELSLEIRKVSVQRLLEDVQTSYQNKAKDKNITLSVDPIDRALVVLVDPDRLIQVLGNLVSNALRYTPEGGYVRLSAAEAAKGIEINVADSGPGILKADIPYVFDRFYRGDKSRIRDIGGSGLGLAIAKSLVNALQGDIRVSSQPGHGTIFTIWLPQS